MKTISRVSSWRERLERQLRVAERGRIERVEVLEVAMKAAGQLRERDVERVEVLVRVLGVHFDDERVASARRAGRPSGRART